jgi:hypothetical protein
VPCSSEVQQHQPPEAICSILGMLSDVVRCLAILDRHEFTPTCSLPAGDQVCSHISQAVVGIARFTPVVRCRGRLFFGLRPGYRRRGEWLKRGLLRPKLVCRLLEPVVVVVEGVGCRVGVLGRVLW